jgi:3-carboxy-cis,cis-muconate cycloisomerase
MASMLLSCLSTTGPLSEVFSDESVLEAMLQFERALAKVEARFGLITSDALPVSAGDLNAADLATRAFSFATPGIPFVKALAAYNRDAHWGATSQDVCDTALVLLIRRAWKIIA